MQPKVQKLLYSFFGKYELQSFAKGEKVIVSSEQKIFFLIQGAVRMFGVSRDGIELTINVYKPKALFPMSLILNQKKDRYEYDALTKAEGYFAPKNDFEEFIQNHPEVLYDLLRRIYQGLEGFFMRLEVLLAGDAYIRVLTQLIIHTRRFGMQDKDRVVFDWQLTHRQLSSQTGLARESVTREIKKLQDKGLIGYMGKKLFIHDFAKLEVEYLSYVIS